MTKILFARYELIYEELDAHEYVEYLHSMNIYSMPYVEVHSSNYNDSWTGFKPDKIKKLNEVIKNGENKIKNKKEKP